MTGATSVAGAAYPSGAPEFTPRVCSGVRVTRSLVLCVYFVARCFSFCPFSFGHCVVCILLFYSKRIGGIMVSVLTANVFDHGFEFWWGQTINNETGICNVDLR